MSVGQSVLLVTQTTFHFLTKGVHAWHNDCLWCVDDIQRFQIMDMTSESYILKICLTAGNNNSSFIF